MWENQHNQETVRWSLPHGRLPAFHADAKGANVKVKELIVELQKHDPEAPVLVELTEPYDTDAATLDDTPHRVYVVGRGTVVVSAAAAKS